MNELPSIYNNAIREYEAKLVKLTDVGEQYDIIRRNNFIRPRALNQFDRSKGFVPLIEERNWNNIVDGMISSWNYGSADNVRGFEGGIGGIYKNTFCKNKPDIFSHPHRHYHTKFPYAYQNNPYMYELRDECEDYSDSDSD